jgi:hypothetical protein
MKFHYKFESEHTNEYSIYNEKDVHLANVHPANAKECLRLFVLAPELLSALEDAINFFDYSESESHVFAEEIRTLISKAKGGL